MLFLTCGFFSRVRYGSLTSAKPSPLPLDQEESVNGSMKRRFYGLDPAVVRQYAGLFPAFSALQRESFLEPVHPVTKKTRAHSFPYISGDGFRQLADVVVEEFDPNDVSAAISSVSLGGKAASAVKPGTAVIVFCAQHSRDTLINAGFLDAASVDVVLILHNSDASGPSLDDPMLKHVRLRAVFTQNCLFEVGKVRCIPIGLANRHWPHGSALAELTTAISANAAAAFSSSGCPMPPLVGHACFSFTHPEREPLRAILNSLSWVSAACSQVPSAYYDGISSSDVIISPRGNGIDAHRSWEALLLGRLVITRHSTIDALWHDSSLVPSWQLPVFLLNEWQSLSLVQTTSAVRSACSVSSLQRGTDRAFILFWACEIGTAAGRAPEFCSTSALLELLAKP